LEFRVGQPYYPHAPLQPIFIIKRDEQLGCHKIDMGGDIRELKARNQEGEYVVSGTTSIIVLTGSSSFSYLPTNVTYTLQNPWPISRSLLVAGCYFGLLPCSSILINCSNKNLKEVPNQFDEQTIALLAQSNQIVSLPATVRRLTSVMMIDLSQNRLTALPMEICLLANVMILNLAHNQLVALPNELGGLKSLSKLQLENNMLTAIPSSVSSLAALSVLSLAKNWQMKEAPDISSLHLLKMVTLSLIGAPLLPPVPPLFAWQQRKQLGKGNFGAVYTTEASNVLAKVSHNPVMNDLCGEAAIMQHLGHHRAIPRFFGFEANTLFIERFLDTQTLSRAVTPGLEASVQIYLLMQLADALAFMHSKKIMHNDLNVNNIIMNHNWNLFLIDMGLASYYGSAPHYEAVEVLSFSKQPVNFVRSRCKADCFSERIAQETRTCLARMDGVCNDRPSFREIAHLLRKEMILCAREDQNHREKCWIGWQDEVEPLDPPALETPPTVSTSLPTPPRGARGRWRRDGGRASGC